MTYPQFESDTWWLRAQPSSWAKSGSLDPTSYIRGNWSCQLQSEVTWPGVPCFENTWVRNIQATWGASTMSWVGMNSDCLVSLSMITRIAVNPSNMGSCSMKSIEINSQGWAGIGSCLRSLYGLWHGALVCEQLVQDFT